MREFSVAEIKRHFAYAGEPTALGYDLDELRWRMYQWRKMGLMYFSERVDRLMEEGRISACFAVSPQQERMEKPQFIPEPFPVLADVYDALLAGHQWDQVAFLTGLAHFKLAHESAHAHTRFSHEDEYGLYCAFIDRFYDARRPYRGTRLYWILFDEKGVEYFSDAFNLDAERLEKFMVRKSGRDERVFDPPGWNN